GCPSSQPPTVTVAAGPGDIDVNQTTHTAYVANLSGLTAFDANTCNATTQAGCGSTGNFAICPGGTCFGPYFAAVDSSTNTIYEGDGDTSIVAVDGNACDAANLAA